MTFDDARDVRPQSCWVLLTHRRQQQRTSGLQLRANTSGAVISLCCHCLTDQVSCPTTRQCEAVMTPCVLLCEGCKLAQVDSCSDGLLQGLTFVLSTDGSISSSPKHTVHSPLALLSFLFSRLMTRLIDKLADNRAAQTGLMSAFQQQT